jgi:hypothetical protein
VCVCVCVELHVEPEIVTSYVYGPTFGNAESCTMFQHGINAEGFPVTQLCVNTLPGTKVTLITDGI